MRQIEAYLVAQELLLHLTSRVMAPGLYDTFSWPNEPFPAHIGSFPGPFWMEILIGSIVNCSRARSIRVIRVHTHCVILYLKSIKQ